MIGEMNFFGVFVPALLVYLMISLLALAALRPVLRVTGVYAFLWHRPLADFALLVIVLAAVTAFLPRWIS